MGRGQQTTTSATVTPRRVNFYAQDPESGKLAEKPVELTIDAVGKPEDNVLAAVSTDVADEKIRAAITKLAPETEVLVLLDRSGSTLMRPVSEQQEQVLASLQRTCQASSWSAYGYSCRGYGASGTSAKADIYELKNLDQPAVSTDQLHNVGGGGTPTGAALTFAAELLGKSKNPVILLLTDDAEQKHPRDPKPNPTEEAVKLLKNKNIPVTPVFQHHANSSLINIANSALSKQFGRDPINLTGDAISPEQTGNVLATAIEDLVTQQAVLADEQIKDEFGPDGRRISKLEHIDELKLKL